MTAKSRACWRIKFYHAFALGSRTGFTHEIVAEAQPASRSAFSLEKGVFFQALVMAVACNNPGYIQLIVYYASAQQLSAREYVTVIQPKLASEISCVNPAAGITSMACLLLRSCVPGSRHRCAQRRRDDAARTASGGVPAPGHSGDEIQLRARQPSIALKAEVTG
jgi:hypothetical protein